MNAAVMSEPATAAPAPGSDDAQHRRGWWAWIGGVAVAVVAFALRIPAIGFGLPYLWHPDEPTNMIWGTAMAAENTWLPHHYPYPGMTFDVIALVTHLHGLFASSVPPYGGVAVRNGGTGYAHYPELFWTTRSIVAVASVGVCIVVYVGVYRLTRQIGAALLAAGLLAVSPLMVTNGVFITPDTFAALFTAVALVGSMAIVRRGRLVDYVVAGTGVGLATGSKYNAGMVAVALLAAHVLRHRRDVYRSLAPLRRLLAAGAAAVVSLVVSTPAFVLEPSAVYTAIQKERNHYAEGHPGMVDSTIRFYLEQLLHGDLVLVVLAVTGAIALIGRFRREAVTVAVFGLPYFVFMASQKVYFERNLLPLLPALALLAGLAVATAVELVHERLPRQAQTPALGAAAFVGLLLLVPQVVGSTRVPGELAEHPRTEARTWLVDHLPSGAKVAVDGFSPYLDETDLELVHEGNIVTAWTLPTKADALVVTELGSGRYLERPDAFSNLVKRYRSEILSRYCPAARFDDGPWIEILTRCDR